MAAVPKRILVVDDNEDIREIIMLILQTEGYTVTGLDNGHQVLQLIHNERPDLLLLDVRLGDMDGRDICKEMKQDPCTRDIPVIIISASHGRHTAHEKMCGANDYISKPFDIEELLGHVRHFAA